MTGRLTAARARAMAHPRDQTLCQLARLDPAAYGRYLAAVAAARAQAGRDLARYRLVRFVFRRAFPRSRFTPRAPRPRS